MRYSPLLALLSAGFLFVSSAMAQERRDVPAFTVFGEPATAADAAAIDSLLTSFRLSWSEEDADALASLHSDDTEWINAYARIFRGEEDLRDFLMHRLFPAFEPGVSREEMENLRSISRRYIGDDAAVVHMYTEGNRGESRNADETARRTHMHLVLAKQNGAWEIVHTAIMDAR